LTSGLRQVALQFGGGKSDGRMIIDNDDTNRIRHLLVPYFRSAVQWDISVQANHIQGKHITP
jgi:hypothetical protein